MCSRLCSADSMQSPRHARAAHDVEHPFGTIKARMGATHFLVNRLPRVAAEMALHVLADNMTRTLNIGHGAERPDFRLCTGRKRSRSSAGARSLCAWSKPEKHARKRSRAWCIATEAG
jgi:hypothetical protein